MVLNTPEIYMNKSEVYIVKTRAVHKMYIYFQDWNQIDKGRSAQLESIKV